MIRDYRKEIAAKVPLNWKNQDVPNHMHTVEIPDECS
jgi:hypothetical protein